MGKHVNADATGDDDESSAAAGGAGDGTHNGAARHSAEGGEPLESHLATIAEADPDGGRSDVE